MYVLTTGDIVGIVIALLLSLFMIVILAYANASLIKENRFLRSRLRAKRKQCENHVDVPF